MTFFFIIVHTHKFLSHNASIPFSVDRLSWWCHWSCQHRILSCFHSGKQGSCSCSSVYVFLSISMYIFFLFVDVVTGFYFVHLCVYASAENVFREKANFPSLFLITAQNQESTCRVFCYHYSSFLALNFSDKNK